MPSLLSSQPEAKLQRLFAHPSMMAMLPDAAFRLIQQLDTDAPNRDLEATLASDPALAASLLKAARSAAFGLDSGRTVSLGGAILVLGHDAVRSLALSLLLQGMLNRPSEAIGFDPTRLARHGLFVALLSSEIGRRVGLSREVRHAVFAVAALHDLGVGLSALLEPSEFASVAAHAKAKRQTYELAYQEVNAASVHRLGAAASRGWRLPEVFGQFLDALAGGSLNELPAANLVVLADLLAIRSGFGLETWEVDEVREVALPAVGLTPSDLEAAVHAANEELSSYEKRAA